MPRLEADLTGPLFVGKKRTTVMYKGCNGMQLVTRSLDFVAAMILEVTVMYVDNTFDDVLSPGVRFLAFTSASTYLSWRALDLWELVKLPSTVAARKTMRKLGLTVLGEIVFSTFCVREDG